MWQPMKSLPIDGTEVLLTDGKTRHLGFWTKLGHCVDLSLPPEARFDNMHGFVPLGWAPIEPLPSPGSPWGPITKSTDIPKEIPLDPIPAEPCFRSSADLQEIAENLTQQIAGLAKRRDQMLDLAKFIETLPTN